MSLENIDNIINRSETSKALPLSDGAWHRLDDMLNADEHKTQRSKMWWMGIAASFILLITAFIAYQPFTNQPYQLEQLVIEKDEVIFSSSEIALLNEEYQNQNIHQLRPEFNRDAEVKATLY